MKAIIYDNNIPGKLELRETEKPAPGKGEVLVRVRAVSVNAADYRSMKLGIVPKRHIYGADMRRARSSSASIDGGRRRPELETHEAERRKPHEESVIRTRCFPLLRDVFCHPVIFLP